MSGKQEITLAAKRAPEVHCGCLCEMEVTL